MPKGTTIFSLAIAAMTTIGTALAQASAVRVSGRITRGHRRLWLRPSPRSCLASGRRSSSGGFGA